MAAVIAVAVLLLAPSARGQMTAVNSPNGQPLSVRIANYSITAKLDTVQKTLDATEILEYRNPSSQPLSTFPFHLYLNAFRPQSSFSQEAHRDGARGGALDSYSAAQTGGIQITGISAEGYGDLLPTLRFTAPDDGNIDDHTVVEVTLPQPLAPGERGALSHHLS